MNAQQMPQPSAPLGGPVPAVTTGFFGRRDGYGVPLAFHEVGRLDTHIGDWRPRHQRRVPTSWVWASALLASRRSGLRGAGWNEPYMGADSFLGRIIARRSRHHQTHSLVYSYHWPGYLAGGGDPRNATVFAVHPNPGLIRSALATARAEDPEFGHLTLEAEEKWSAETSDRVDSDLRQAPRILCASDFVAKGFKGLMPEGSRPIVIPYGVDPQPLAERGRRSRLTLLWLGEPTYRKGFFHLLRALRPLQDRVELRCLVRSRARLEEVHLPPNVDVRINVSNSALTQHFGEAEAFVMPSLAEGFGLAILEAMARGLPVVTTARTGVVDLVGQGGGFLVEAGSVSDLTRTLSNIADHRNVLGPMGQVALTASRTYSWERFREQVRAHA